MPSSISSFERFWPSLPWTLAISLASLMFCAFVAFMELRLADLGYHPTINDSIDRWLGERKRASDLGQRAIILVGASRIQLDIDTDKLRNETDLTPVMLAIDGTSSLPVLKNLADDPAISGIVVFDYYDHILTSQNGQELAVRAVSRYLKYQPQFNSRSIEKPAEEFLRYRLRSYADNASPFLSLMTRIGGNIRAQSYLVTLPDRSRYADYTLVPMPGFYHRRVIRNLGEEINPGTPNLESVLKERVSRLTPADNATFKQNITAVSTAIGKIQERGGQVVVVQFPSSGMVREIEERRYPRDRFSDLFAASVKSPFLRTSDIPGLREFTCPDGSHLDMRDRTNFTAALAAELRARVPALQR